MKDAIYYNLPIGQNNPFDYLLHPYAWIYGKIRLLKKL